MPELDIAGLVAALNAHGVAYVVIGGVAARYGPLDLVFAPDGAPGGFEDLVASAEELPVTTEGNVALVVSLRRWRQLKEASGREKDLEHLDLLSEGGD